MTEADPGLGCLVVIAYYHGIAADPAQLAHQFAVNSGNFSETEILLAARALNLRAKIVRLPLDRIDRAPMPALIVVYLSKRDFSPFMMRQTILG